MIRGPAGDGRVAAVTGRPTSYVAETVDEAYASRESYGAPAWQLDAWVSTYLASTDGSQSAVTTAIPELTGHPATRLEQLLRLGDVTANP